MTLDPALAVFFCTTHSKDYREHTAQEAQEDDAYAAGRVRNALSMAARVERLRKLGELAG